MTLPIIKQLYDLGKLNLEPAYQREAVWTKSQRQLLIDSLIRNYDIPKLYFRAVDGPGTIEYEVVDGQQRIRTVISYFNNGFRLDADADPVDKVLIANCLCSELPTEAMMALNMAALDIVILSNYSEERVRDLFERLQNGTSLNAAEKRHALLGGMSEVVRGLGKHKVFSNIADFSSARYAYEDMAAKTLHEVISGKITDIRPSSIKATYDGKQKLKSDDAPVQKINKVYNFLDRALKGKTVKLKKYAFLSLSILVTELLDSYNLGRFPVEFGEWYEQFEKERIANNEIDDSDKAWDKELAEFTDNARNDSVAALTYRDKILRERLFAKLINLEPLDKNRGFSAEQRLYIYLRDQKTCQDCSKAIESLEEMHADHTIPHASGGPTTAANGRALCIPCNLAKSANIA